MWESGSPGSRPHSTNRHSVAFSMPLLLLGLCLNGTLISLMGICGCPPREHGQPRRHCELWEKYGKGESFFHLLRVSGSAGFSFMVYLFRYHRLETQTTNSLPQDPRGWKVKVKALAGQLFPRPLLIDGLPLPLPEVSLP